MNRSNKAESPNLPNPRGMSAGIPAELGPHPARENQGVPKSPAEKQWHEKYLVFNLPPLQCLHIL